MTDLRRLRVSLTKHNAHKVAQLLKEHEATEVLGRLHEIHADAAQARKNLSALPGDALPAFWGRAKVLGEDAIDALVLIGIIFSHHELIAAMQEAGQRSALSGQIERGVQLNGKAYTNFVQIIDSLGFATKREFHAVTFNLKPIFEIPGLPPLVRELLESKLVEARWDRSGNVADEAIRLGFHLAFGLTSEEFKGWLNLDVQPAAAGSSLLPKDAEFFEDAADSGATTPFEFRSGHIERDVEPLTRTASSRSKANRLHNDLQNRLYNYLAQRIGAKNVGTEVDTGNGTLIDVVTQLNGWTTFYEIKTASTVRACIRQALPQLLEYAFWPNDFRANELVIISHLAITNQAKIYIKYLNDKFNIPIKYRQFLISSNDLI